MGFGNAYNRLRCDQEYGKDEKDVGCLLDNWNCFPLWGLFAGHCRHFWWWKSNTTCMCTCTCSSLYTHISFIRTLKLRAFLVYRAPTQSRLPWKQWCNALKWKRPRDTNLSEWCWHCRPVLLSRGRVRGARQRGPLAWLNSEMKNTWTSITGCQPRRM